MSNFFLEKYNIYEMQIHFPKRPCLLFRMVQKYFNSDHGKLVKLIVNTKSPPEAKYYCPLWENTGLTG